MSDEFGDRMKGYEAVWDTKLPARMPVILRLDGNSFSKFTKSFNKPFDERMWQAMTAASKAVLDYCSGAQIAYHQSDEITILLRNDQTLNTQTFLANRIQKIASLCASTASVNFNEKIKETGATRRNAIFDCRVFVVPDSEVNNVFYWRQQDCFKNFVSTSAWHLLGEKFGKKKTFRMLQGVNTRGKIELVYNSCDVDLLDYFDRKWQYGTSIYKKESTHILKDIITEDHAKKLVSKEIDIEKEVTRSYWFVDTEIPKFSDDKNFIERLLKEKE